MAVPVYDGMAIAKPCLTSEFPFAGSGPNTKTGAFYQVMGGLPASGRTSTADRFFTTLPTLKDLFKPVIVRYRKSRMIISLEKLVHVVECAEILRPMMREIWRVLSSNGRLLVIAPNRRGIWARLEHTPLGHGRPYTSSQLYRLLRETLCKPVSKNSAVVYHPLNRG